MLKKFFRKLLFLVRLEATYAFWRSGYLKKLGWFKSFYSKEPIDVNREPIPWYTYPAIEYIKQLDFSDKEVFEYGSGNSTLFWSKISKKVISIENNQKWYEKVLKQVGENVNLKLVLDETSYIKEILNYEGFDVIIIDGSCRFECTKVAISKLKAGGMIILDNSDWYMKTTKFLRDSDLIQVDMSGMGPINVPPWTTSFFFHRDFRFQPKTNNQPEHAINAIKHYANEES
ncbi:MAG: class I SAM-dependent methyltransferase [Hydrococcus sp. Prado102]|jgi:protein-L-isoaspartate O-methyltransferase|nr:class I SAM-dependent methyltransferase [Hydrococcus sp. Prado102]